MAKLKDLSDRLLNRFKDVPNVEDSDVEGWVEMAMNEHGFISTDDVPTEFIPLIMLYAEADGAMQVALRTAHYFSFVDKDESIDKSMISEQYRKLAEELWNRYGRKKDEGVGDFGGSSFHIMKRADRP